jgi:hypothetical protein
VPVMRVRGVVLPAPSWPVSTVTWV